MHRIGVVGISYRHATVDQVARFALPKAEIPQHLPRLRAALKSDELVYVATCNRVEVFFAMRQGTADDRRRAVFKALVGREPNEGEAVSTMRTWTGEAAVEHLFLVACGLDSAQAGEQEIATQLRWAWQAARDNHVSGPVLDRIFSEALGMARHARRLGRYDAPSLADLAVERVIDQLAGRSEEVALIGVSPMTRRCAIRLRNRGVQLAIVNRSRDTAEEFAREVPARVVSLEDFRAHPSECAALVCATGASEPVLERATLEALAQTRNPPLIIDFGLPPNIDPAAAAAAGLERIGMSDLVKAAQDTRVTHLLKLAPVRSAIDDRLARLRRELAARAVGPQLAELRDTFERMATADMQTLLSSELPDLDAQKRQRLLSWAATLAHRLAHLPLSGVRAAAEHAGPEALEAFFREAKPTAAVQAPPVERTGEVKVENAAKAHRGAAFATRRD
jgi:glutamyl-tRNA reductase